MKKSFFFLFLLVCACLSAQEVKVSAVIDQSDISPGQEIKGLLTVIHGEDQAIDLGSVQMEGKKLEIVLERQVPLSAGGGGLMSIYRFILSPKERGLHELQEIAVKVGGAVYRTIPSTFSVGNTTSVSSSRSSAQQRAQQPQKVYGGSSPSNSGHLRLEAKVEGNQPLYPGERARFVYRYLYKGNIELSQENLPLFNADDFAKIGERVVKDYTEGGVSVREISQEVQATKPGEYSIGPSLIVGMVYDRDFFGRKIYSPNALKAEAPAVSIVVKDFPAAGKPASFNGAVGRHMTFKTRLASKPQVAVGDSISLSMEISGEGSVKNTPPPDLCCQPGFAGNFKPSDIPPAGTVSGNTITFIEELKPLNERIKEIPAVEFSYFDAETKRYATLKSAPIPLKVLPLKTPPPENLDKPENNPSAPPSKEAPAIPIAESYPLTMQDMEPPVFGSFWAIWLLPICVGAFLLQRSLYAEIERKKNEIPVKTADALFQEALVAKNHGALFVRLITAALIKRLYDAGLVGRLDINAEELPNAGKAGEVKRYLELLDQTRFAKGEEQIDDKLLQEAKALYDSIGEGSYAP